jgi:hypothetical protein
LVVRYRPSLAVSLVMAACIYHSGSKATATGQLAATTFPKRPRGNSPARCDVLGVETQHTSDRVLSVRTLQRSPSRYRSRFRTNVACSDLAF